MPKGIKFIGGKFSFMTKQDLRGNVKRYKVYLVLISLIRWTLSLTGVSIDGTAIVV